MKSIKLFMLLIILITSYSYGKSIKLSFKEECVLSETGSYPYFYVLSHLNLNGKNNSKIYQIQCFKHTKKCIGVDLSTSDKSIGMLGLLPQSFDAGEVFISPSAANFRYKNTFFSVDNNDKKVKMIIHHPNQKPNEEIWEGKCK